jgi:membrane-associated protein
MVVSIFEISLIDLIFHLDKYLGLLISTFGPLTYIILFAIIFFETGLVFLPFLPGDSLLFLSGTFAATGALNYFILFFLLIFAAVIGDSVNYFFGKFIGEKFFLKHKLIKKVHLDRASEFYEKHGGKAIILARFVPIVRSVAPFVAGVSKMNYAKFLSFNIIGGVAWVSIFLTLGYFFGTMPIVQENLTLVLVGIVVISLVPVLFEVINNEI